jgi:diguanylate cyclase (GGDEF)-like protein/PAS domain S-box-containing protein
MSSTTKILILEDRATDAELVCRELRSAGLDFNYLCVSNKDAFIKAVDEFDPALIVSDFSLPNFTGLEALEVLKERNIEKPFILCTGTIGEEMAVECMKNGASDYVLKTSLKRLPTAVTNALESAAAREGKAQALAALQANEERYRLLFETNPHPIWVFDTETLKFLAVNEAAVRKYGYSREEFLSLTLKDLRPRDTHPDLLRTLKRAKDTDEVFYKGKHKRKDGNTIDVETASQTISFGDRRARINIVTDVTEKKRAEEQLLHDAFHDALTGLPNRSLFLNHLEFAIARSLVDEENKCAVLFIDFDRFKVICDSLGYAAGDILLKVSARRLEASVRSGDVVARIGGNSFTVLLNRISDSSQALQEAERLSEILKAPVEITGQQIDVTATTGVAVAGGNYHGRAEDVIRNAAIASDDAKAKGRGLCQVYDPSVHKDASSRLRIELEMKQALDDGQFELLYQPIVDVQTSSLCGFESLIRWNHPELGVVLPGDFIPIAEDNGFIFELGQWAVEMACRQLSSWKKDFDVASGLTMSVNLSCKQFMQADLAERIVSTLFDTGLDPLSLKLEITESHIMQNSELAVSLIEALRGLGVEFSLDDFGTGYSSLSYLHRLPVSYLKIDRSFVGGMMQSGINEAIVKTIIELAQSLKMQVVAEGIETQEQFEQLRSWGCEFGQGYFLARPLRCDDAERLISRQTFPIAFTDFEGVDVYKTGGTEQRAH